MEIAIIQVENTSAHVEAWSRIPAGMSGAQIRVNYVGSVWGNLTKTIIFRGAVTKDVVTESEIINIPPEVLAKPGCLAVGFYGVDNENNLAIPTFWETVGLIDVAADPSGDETTDPSLPVWAQLADRVSDLEKTGPGGGDLTGYAKEVWVEEHFQAKGNYALKSEIPSVPVQSVNGKTGSVVLDAAAVGARPDTWTPTYSDVGAEKSGTAATAVGNHNVNTDAHNDIRLLIAALANRLDALANSDDDTLDQMVEVVAYIKDNRNLIEQITTGKVNVSDIVNNLTTNVANKPLSAAQGLALKALIDAIAVPTNLSQLINDKGFITDYTETDPTVPAWAKAASKPSYSKSEVGLGNVDNVKQYSAINPPPYPVTSVNGETGAVKLDAGAVGARPATWTPSYADVGAEKSGTAATAVGSHNVNTDAHNDIRLLIAALANRLDALANSDDDTLDQMAEIVAYIKDNRNLIEQITTGKVSVADIVNNLTTNVSNKPLSAAQGVALKALIDAITIPTKLSQLTNDEGFITGYTETDPTVPSWAKASSKPSYSKSEVGLGNVDNVKQYSASNPPPYPVTSVNGETGAVTLDASAVGARPDTWTPTAANVGAVPTSRTINGKKLSSNITLDASDVGAVPTTQTITVTGVDADGVSHSWTMYGVAQ